MFAWWRFITESLLFWSKWDLKVNTPPPLNESQTSSLIYLDSMRKARSIDVDTKTRLFLTRWEERKRKSTLMNRSVHVGSLRLVDAVNKNSTVIQVWDRSSTIASPEESYFALPVKFHWHFGARERIVVGLRLSVLFFHRSSVRRYCVAMNNRDGRWAHRKIAKTNRQMNAKKRKRNIRSAPSPCPPFPSSRLDPLDHHGQSRRAHRCWKSTV